MSIENLVQNRQLQKVPTFFQGRYIANVYKGVITGFPIPSGGFKGEPLNTLQAVNETLLMGIPDSYCIFQVWTNVS